MHLEGSCHCGKIKFTVESAEPVPFMRCYCSICRKTAGGGGYAINVGAATKTIDTPLPMPPENVHCLLDSKASWVRVEGQPGDPHFDHYPDISLAQWHESKGLTSQASAD